MGLSGRRVLRFAHRTPPPSGPPRAPSGTAFIAECDSPSFRLTPTPSGRKPRRASVRGVLGRASRLNDRDGGNWLPRQVDGEHASSTREVARIDPAIVRFSAPSAEGETKTHAGSIGAALLERAKELVDIPTRQTAALVLDLDEHALGACANPERDARPRPCELEGVLQKVSHDRGENCLSAAIARPSSTGVTMSLTPRAFASNVDADAISSMNAATGNCSRF